MLACVNAGIFLFGLGLAMKTLIADPLGRTVDQIFGLGADAVTPAIAWIGALCYTLQIFYDFAGYSEMAIGLGLLMGFTFPENFRQPYRSRSITEFWRRWHMTLSAWFRDYLYIPLGGNRGSQLATLRNLWIVFLLCGIWHGAAWTFVVWGAYHGALLVIERVLRKRWPLEGRSAFGLLTTLLLVIIGWVFFRAESMSQAGMMLSRMSFLDSGEAYLFGPEHYLTPHTVFLLLAGFVLAMLPVEGYLAPARLATGALWGPATAMLGLALTVFGVGELAATGFNPFIYFQF